MKVLFSLIMGMVIVSGAVSAQKTDLPKVFTLGEQEQAYEKLTQEYSQSLLEACDLNIETAFQRWLEMMQEMEKYAAKINFDIKGVKLWMHVFWSETGKIDHIGYLLRSDSKNINAAELNAFLSSFMGRYTFPVSSGKKYNHYTGATFPTFIERLSD